ncbi:MAG: hypothetical protein KC800_01680 [Candidatus Eremiobacteraeota bacterium]|nr:hypothetical protein [Candidatus Eremiobacteraeota bacterium]
MKRLIAGALLGVFMVGCSGESRNDKADLMSVEVISTEVAPETPVSSETATRHGVQGAEGTASNPKIKLSSSPAAENSEEAEAPVIGKQTKMNITPGTERIWQNGPTSEEVARSTTVKENPPVTYDEVGNGSPLMDPQAGLEEIRR